MPRAWYDIIHAKWLLALESRQHWEVTTLDWLVFLIPPLLVIALLETPVLMFFGGGSWLRSGLLALAMELFAGVWSFIALRFASDNGELVGWGLLLGWTWLLAGAWLIGLFIGKTLILAVLMRQWQAIYAASIATVASVVVIGAASLQTIWCAPATRCSMRWRATM